MADKFKNKYRLTSARLLGWDYRWNAAYFITICTKDRKMFLGNIKEGKMNLSAEGKIAQRCWLEIPEHFPFVVLNEFAVMPNHVHGIVILNHNNFSVETLHCNASTEKNEHMASISPKFGSVATVVRSYKSAVTKEVRETHSDFAWQTRFYDHIIRNADSFQHIQNYIINNPGNWETDRFYF